MTRSEFGPAADLPPVAAYLEWHEDPVPVPEPPGPWIDPAWWKRAITEGRA